VGRGEGEGRTGETTKETMKGIPPYISKNAIDTPQVKIAIQKRQP